MSTIDVGIKVTADSRGAVSGLRPLDTELKKIEHSSKEAEKALKDLGDKHKINIDDDPVDRAKREIKRLREQMRDDLRLDVNADTRDTQRKIRALRSSIKELEREDINLDVDVDKTAVSRLETTLGGLGRTAGKVPGVLKAVAGIAATATLGLSGVAVGVGGIVLESLKLADAMANAKIAFTQFLGSGAKANAFLSDLEDFAAKTPFEFPELVESSKQLLAFGIKGKDVVGIMTTLGDAAALTGAQVTDLTTIWGQMQAKGKVANEELLQLTEHGIPAYKLLADALGKPVSEIQRMASKGELLSDDVLPILQSRLNKTFGGGMAKQAQTLGGLFSTMQDTLSSIGRELGAAFTPVVAEQIDNLTGKLEEWSTWASENKQTIVQTFSEMAATFLGTAADMALAASGIIESFAGILDTIDQLSGFLKLVSPAWRGYLHNFDPGKAADGMHTLADEVGKLAPGLNKARDEARSTGRDFAESFAKSDAIQRTKNDIKDVQEELKGLRKQPPSAAIDLKIDNAKVRLAGLRADLKTLTGQDYVAKVQAKIDDARTKITEIKTSLAYLRTQKPTPEIKARISKWKADLATVKGDLRALRRQKTEALIKARADAAAKARTRGELNGVANPGGKGRTAHINASVTGEAAAKSTLDTLAQDRQAYINVTVRKHQEATDRAGTSAQSIVPQLFPATDSSGTLRAGARALVGPQAMVASSGAYGYSSGAGGGQPNVVQLAPRQVPVKVYLDGQEIADHLTAKARRMATSTSLRRRA